MKVTEFSEETKVDNVIPPWAQYMSEDDFISYMPSYKGGEGIPLFDDYILDNDSTVKVGPMRYYLFDPIKHGADSSRKYPLIIFIHGATNALDGKICVGHSGGEMFATPSYQEKLGGAYILVPLANEKKDEKGELIDSWSEDYIVPLKSLIDTVVNGNANIGKVIVGGGSSGGYMTWEMMEAYPDYFAAVFPVSSHYMPAVESLKKVEEKGVSVFYGCAKHDEFGAYDESNREVYEYISSMKNSILFLPEFLRNGDKGVASLYFGIEMGQHCVITQLQADFMYDDGTPYCNQMPKGFTGWLASVGMS